MLRWGEELTVKIPHPDPEAVSACLTHARVSTAARGLGVAAPEVVTVEDLRPLIEEPLIVSRFLIGDRLASGDTAEAVWTAVGHHLARLHAATAAQMPAGLRVFAQHAEVDLAAMSGRLRAADRLTADHVRRLQGLREALVGFVLPDDRPVLCHGDIHAGNVIAAAGRFVGLVDFAGAGWLDAAWDFVGVPVAAVPLMLDGYRRDGARDGSLLERIIWCRLQQALDRAADSADPDQEASRAIAEADQLLR